MFRTGQKVVCVHAETGWHGVPSRLHHGAVYTVLDAFQTYAGPGVLLFEVDLPKPFVAWDAGRFRHVQQRKTDISAFKKLLVPSKVDEPV